ncbi:MAG: hypothetical protein M3P39_11095 [Actinomycetota bacterium]|nr:hypothetical protein [Actinomycetota bacterium]
MDLEERTLEPVGDRCEACGARLTPAELATALEASGPALCRVHASEELPLDEAAEDVEGT